MHPKRSHLILKNFSKDATVIGIIGGGQLSRMLCLAAARLGIRTTTLERKADCPASSVSDHHIVGDWNDPQILLKLADCCDVITLENEFVNPDAIIKLEETGCNVLPSSASLISVQDKFHQKQLFEKHDLPIPEFQNAASLTELRSAADRWGFPLILKRRRNAYDGKGNFTIRSEAEIQTGWERLQGEGHPLFVEAFCPFKAEIAVIICRSSKGKIIPYPVVETIQKNHICHIVKAPANIDLQSSKQALSLAKAAVSAIRGVGSMGVEMFLTNDDQILLNELAPRVHNSGHYSIEACETSQFENHIRAITSLPLKSSKMIKPAAVMINLLGEDEGDSFSGSAYSLEKDGVHLHLYGKNECRVGRKMGHLTVLGKDIDDAFQTAKAANIISFLTDSKMKNQKDIHPYERFRMFA